MSARWTAAAAESGRPRFKPASVSGAAHAAAPRLPASRTEDRASVPGEPALPADDTTSVGDAGSSSDGEEELTPPAARKPREGRFGAIFGTTVHQGIGLVLRDRALAPADAVRRAAEQTGLADHLNEAAEDVGRALHALEAEGLLRPLGPELQTEYPVVGNWGDGLLLSGYIDLVGAATGQLTILDFKTDTPPGGPIELAYPEYVRQVRTYADLLAGAGVAGACAMRCGLLFTVDGTVRWATTAPDC